PVAGNVGRGVAPTVRLSRLRSPGWGIAAMSPVVHDSRLVGISHPELVPRGDDSALRTSRGRSDATPEARSVRHGERETPRGLQVVARGDELPGAQTGPHADHVSSPHRPSGAATVGVPCTHGRDSAGDEADTAPRTEGLADSSIRDLVCLRNEVGRLTL